MKSFRVISLTATLMSLVLMSAVASSQTEEASAPDAAPAPAAMEKTSGADHIPIHTPDAPLPSYQESPVLAALVQAGELPPVAERLPDLPAVVTPYDRIGKHGGTLKAPDGLYTNFRYITRYLNEGLYDITAPSGTTMYANLAESLDISDDYQTFTINLRPGLKWSDGAPVTAADVMFTVNDIHLFVDPGADAHQAGRGAARAQDGRRTAGVRGAGRLHHRGAHARAVHQLQAVVRHQPAGSHSRALPQAVPSQLHRGRQSAERDDHRAEADSPAVSRPGPPDPRSRGCRPPSRRATSCC